MASRHDDKSADDPRDNVVDLAAMRRRQETIAKRAKDAKEARGHDPRRKGKGPSGMGRRGQVRWYHYLQFILFMALLAYFMQLCQGGH